MPDLLDNLREAAWWWAKNKLAKYQPQQQTGPTVWPPQQWVGPGQPAEPGAPSPQLGASPQAEKKALAIADAASTAMSGAAIGLLMGGPPGALAGAVLPFAYGHNRNIDDMFNALPPTLAVVPPATKAVRTARITDAARRGGYISAEMPKKGEIVSRLVEGMRKDPAYAQEANDIHKLINARDSAYHATDLEGFKGILEAGEISSNPWLHQGLGKAKQKQLMGSLNQIKTEAKAQGVSSTHVLYKKVQAGELTGDESAFLLKQIDKSAKSEQVVAAQKSWQENKPLVEGYLKALKEGKWELIDSYEDDLLMKGIPNPLAAEFKNAYFPWMKKFGTQGYPEGAVEGKPVPNSPWQGVSVSRVPRISSKSSKAITFVIDRKKMPKARPLAELGYGKVPGETNPTTWWDYATPEELAIYNGLTTSGAEKRAIVEKVKARIVPKMNPLFEFENRTFGDPIPLEAVKGILVDEAALAKDLPAPSAESLKAWAKVNTPELWDNYLHLPLQSRTKYWFEMEKAYRQANGILGEIKQKAEAAGIPLRIVPSGRSQHSYRARFSTHSNKDLWSAAAGVGLSRLLQQQLDDDRKRKRLPAK